MARRTWHICDNCILPLVKDLSDIVQKWDRADWDSDKPNLTAAGYDRITPLTVEMVLDRHHVRFAIVWLEVNAGLELAHRVRDMLYGPVSAYARLEFDSECVLSSSRFAPKRTIYHGEVSRAVAEWDYRQWAESGEHGDDDTPDRFFNRFGDIKMKLQQARDYLGMLAVVLRDRFGDSAITLEAGDKVEPPPTSPSAKQIAEVRRAVKLNGKTASSLRIQSAVQIKRQTVLEILHTLQDKGEYSGFSRTKRAPKKRST